MSIVQSIKSSNGSYALLGNPQQQPVTNLSTQASNVSTSNLQLPAYKAPINVSVTTVFNKNIGNNQATQSQTTHVNSVENLISLLSNQDASNSVYITSTDKKRTTFIPSYISDTDIRKIVNSYVFNNTNTIELSNIKPDILLMSDFIELFSTDNDTYESDIDGSNLSGILPHMTNAGVFFNTAVQASRLKLDRANDVIKILSEKYTTVNELLVNIKSNFKNEFNTFFGDIGLLQYCFYIMNYIKTSLNVLDSSHRFDPKKIAKDIINPLIVNTAQQDVISELEKLASKYSQNYVSINDVLKNYVFNTNYDTSKFLSSQAYLELVNHLKYFLSCVNQEQLHNNIKYDIPNIINYNPWDIQYRINDITLTQKQHSQFINSYDKLPLIRDIKSINDLDAIARPANGYLEIISDVQKLYENLFLSSDINDNIVMTLHFLSKEYRYSTAMNNKEFINFYYNYYGSQYNNSTNNEFLGNQEIFDKIIGNVGRKITDYATEQKNSLVSLTQRFINNNEKVITLETLEINDNNNITTGGKYYVDNMMNIKQNSFNVESSKSFIADLSNIKEAFSNAVLYMNLLGIKTEEQNSAYNVSNNIFANPVLLFDFFTVSNNIMNDTGINYSIQNDIIASLIAIKDKKIKSIVFLLLAINAFKTKNNSYNVLLSNLADELRKELQRYADSNAITSYWYKTWSDTANDYVTISLNEPTNSIQYNQPPSNNSNSYSIDDIINKILSNDSIVVKIFTNIFLQSFELFNGAYISSFNGSTRYSMVKDTVIALMIFDLFANVINVFAGCELNVYRTNFGVVNSPIFDFLFYSKINIDSSSAIATYSNIVKANEALLYKTQICIYAAYNIIDVIKNSFNIQTVFANDKQSQVRLNNLIENGILVNSTENNISEQQIMQTTVKISDVTDYINNANADVSDLLLIDDYLITEKKLKYLYAVFGNHKFTSGQFATNSAYNKKILSVAIPNGFTAKIKNRYVNLNDINSFVGNATNTTRKQSDIVKICIYKTNLLHEDLVYKPIKFLFELSRFPVKSDVHYLDLSTDASEQEVYGGIPTRDLSNIDVSVKYWMNSTVDKQRLAFDNTYDFLTMEDKNSLHKNHVLSYLCELYIRILSGVNTSNEKFNVNETSFVNVDKNLINNLIEKIVATLLENKEKIVGNTQLPSNNIVFSSLNNQSNINAVSQTTQISQNDSQSLQTSIQNISYKDLESIIQYISSINDVSHLETVYSDIKTLFKQWVSNKKYDRIFNVLIDPDDFEIDKDLTYNSLHGRNLFDQLVSNGEITTAKYINTNNYNTVNEILIYKDRERTPDDLSLNKFFATIETYDGSITTQQISLK